jgi:rod shape determining protein RodA
VPKRNSLWTNIDWLSVFIFLILVLAGWINIYAAVYDPDYQSIFDISQRYGKQLIWIAAAFVIAFMVLLTESNFYVFFSYIIYFLVIFLLILVLIAGTEINNSRSWFVIGGFSFQPSEFGKIATSLALAKYISSSKLKIKRTKSLAVIASIIILPVLLILMQNDAGSALVYFSLVLVLYREGLSGIVLFFLLFAAVLFILSLFYSGFTIFILLSGLLLLAMLIFNPGIKYFLRTVLIFPVLFLILTAFNELANLSISREMMLGTSLLTGGVIVLIYSLKNRLKNYSAIITIFILSLLFSVSVDYAFYNLLEPHHRVRVNELLGIQSNPLGSGYNVNQSKIAIGSGGMWGKGFLNGTQTKFNFVPEQSTDFIFCTVGEEWGFAGTFTVVLLFIGLFSRLIWLAERQRSSFSRIYGYSVASILFFHFAVNIGMTIGIMPVIGIPLPFFSYGGSSLWSFTILLFIFLRLDASRLDQFSA